MSRNILRFIAAALVFGPVASGASAQATLENVSVRAIGPSPVAIDTSNLYHKATAVCSARRLCKKGWDLALLGTAAPKTGAAVGQPVLVGLAVTNLGRARAPQVPVRVSFSGTTERVMTPELGPGDTVVLVVRVVPRENSDVVDAEIDPEHLAGDRYVDNNSAQSDRISVEREPSLEVAEFVNATPAVRDGAPLRLTLRVRNVSKAAVLSDASLALGVGGSCFPQISPRVAFPALAPQQELSATVVVTEVTKLGGHAYCFEGAVHGRIFAKIVDQGDRELQEVGSQGYDVRH